MAAADRRRVRLTGAGLAAEQVRPEAGQPVALRAAPEAVAQDEQAAPEVAQEEVRAEQEEVRVVQQGERAAPGVVQPVAAPLLGWALPPA